MTDIVAQMFSYGDKKVRAIMIGNEPYFAGNDVAALLGYRSPKNAVATHCKGGTKSVLPSEGGDQEMIVIPVSDVLRLITKSRLPEAQKVESWIFDEVMTKVVRTGQYVPEVTHPQVPQTYLEALEAHLADQKKLQAQGLLLETATKTIKKLTHDGKLYTATELAKELGIRSAEQMNKQLEEMQIQYKVNNTWVLRSWYADKGYTSIKQMELESGRLVYDRKWTGTGREFLLRKFEIIK